MKLDNMPSTKRRQMLQAILGIASVAILSPLKAFAASWNRLAFEATTLSEATKNSHIQNEMMSAEIEIIAPEKAENGAVVQIEINSHIANTESISIFAEKNPTPFIAEFTFKNGALPYVVTRIKMAETCDIKAIIKTDKQYFYALKTVEVLENGCG